MAELFASDADFLKAIEGGRSPEQDAILNPIGFTEGVSSEALSLGTGLLEGVNNLSGNALDILFNVEKSKTADYLEKVYKDESLNPAEKAWELAKYPFQDTEYGMIDALFGQGASKQAKADIQRAQDDFDAKAQLQSEYGVGSAGYNFGKFTGEVAAYAAPVLKAEKYVKGIGGSLHRTNQAFATNATKLDKARAIAGDTLQNAGVFGTTEFLLGKAYGKSDEEATADAMIAALFGGVGTPVVVGGKVLTGKAVDATQLTPEEMAKAAGGGTPEQFGEGVETVEQGFASSQVSKLFTKSGEEITSPEVQSVKQELEKREFEVVEPRENLGEELEGQTYVPTVKNDKKFEYSFDRNGRVYVTGSNLLDPQGTPDMKASLRKIVRDEVTSANDELNRRLEFYDNDSKLQSRYGQKQAKLKPEQVSEETKSGFQKELNRHRFKLDQLEQMSKDNTYTNEVRREAKNEFNKLKKIKLQDKLDKEVREVAKEKFEAQTKVEASVKQFERDKSISDEYQTWKKGQGFTPETTKAGYQINKNIRTDLGNMAKDIRKAFNFVEKQEALKGRKFDSKNITPQQKSDYRNEVGIIEDYQNLLSDSKAYKAKQIDADELSFRAKRILDEQLIRDSKQDFKTRDEILEYQKEIIEKYDRYGIKVQESDVKFKPLQKAMDKFSKKKVETEGADLSKVESQRKTFIRRLNQYRRSGVNPEIKSGDRAGQKFFTDGQLKFIDSKALKPDEIADIYYPVVEPKDAKIVKDANKAKAIKKVQSSTAKDIGVKGRFGLPPSIKFSDTTIDASNSVMQVFTVLLGSKRLAKLSKLYGGTDDVRDIIGKSMENDFKFKKPDGDKTWKDYVKPIFMTENYGQGRDGLIKTQMNKFGWDKQYATEFVDTYLKASDKLVPEMVNVRKMLEQRMQGGSPDFSWTLPDGFRVKVRLNKKQDGSFAVKGKEFPFKVETDNIDEFARALIPGIIHSVDAYIIRRLAKELDVQPTHDAVTMASNVSKADVDRVYSKIMIQLNSGKDKDLLNSIFKEIGIDAPDLKIGDLPSSKIPESKAKLDAEHIAGKVEESELREFDVSKIGTKTDVMRDFMASGNYRQLPTNQLIDSMVNQATYNNVNLKVAREGDDVYERQLALAMQSPKFNSKMAIKAPDGVDVNTWWKAQNEIFNEFRAKIEYNPMYKDVVQGKRMHFNEDGSIIGSNKKSYDQILREEKRRIKAKQKQLRKPIQQFVSEEIQKKVHKLDNEAQVNYQDIVKKAIVDDANRVVETKGLSFKTLRDEQLSNDPLWREYNSLENIRHYLKTDVDRTTELVNDRMMKIKPKKREELTSLVKGNYEYIRGLTKDQADIREKELDELYQRIKPEIDAGVRSLDSHSEKYGYALDNPQLIAERYNLGEEYYRHIGELWAIKAMNHYKGWDTIKKYGADDEDIKYVVDSIGRNRDLSENVLFLNNPKDVIFGYVPEKYLGKKTLDDDGNVVYDTNDVYEAGLLGSERENKKIGDVYDTSEAKPEFKNKVTLDYYKEMMKGFTDDKLTPKERKAFGDISDKFLADDYITPAQERYLAGLLDKAYTLQFDTLEDRLKWMDKNRLRLSNGVYRKVPDESIRKELGKSYDLADILSEMNRQTQEKIKERGVVEKVIMDLNADNSLLYSKTKKENMVELSEEQLKKLPYELRQEMKYVNMNLVDKLVGRNEVRLMHARPIKSAIKKIDSLGQKYAKRDFIGEENQNLKMADRLVADLSKAFKQNVVLKNITSYENSFLFNQAIGLSAGVPFKNMYKYQKQALKDLENMAFIMEKLHLAEVRGDSKAIQNYKKLLRKNELYKMERWGLSTNRVDGVVADDDLAGTLLKDFVPSPIFKLGQVVNLNQKTKAGRFTLKQFSRIDTMGRYMIVKNNLDKGMSMKDAVHDANGLFGNMDKMVPASIQLLDKYNMIPGFVPFMKWFTLTSPRLLKMAKDNPERTLGAAVLIYILGYEMDLNLSTVNPLEGMVDFFADQVNPFASLGEIADRGLVDSALNRAEANVFPKYLSNFLDSPETFGLHKVMKDRIGEPWYDDSVDYRGFTQRNVDEWFEEK